MNEKVDRPATAAEVTRALAEPFDPSEVKFKPSVVSGNRAMAIAYVDARVVQDRLDDVLGVEGWSDDYECLPDGSVVCRLRVRIGEEWVTKVDVGGPSEQQDGGDRMKAAFSDSLKRAAVKFGLGRYLYRLPAQWVDYDPHKRQFARPPQLPGFAMPKKAQRAETPAAAADAPRGKKPAGRRPNMPANGEELHTRLDGFDAKLARQGLCERGALTRHVLAAGEKAGYTLDMLGWPAPAIALAVAEATRFEASLRKTEPSGAPA